MRILRSEGGLVLVAAFALLAGRVSALGACCGYAGVRLRLRGGEAPSAVASQAESIRYPADVEANVREAMGRAWSVWEDECDDARAEEILTTALTAAPQHPDVLCKLGVLLSEARGDVDGAAKMFERALDADPFHVDAMHHSANLFQTEECAEEAEQMYTKAIAQCEELMAEGGGLQEPHPLYVDTLCNYGALLESAKEDIENAEAMYKKALAMRPDHVSALYNYAVLLEDRKWDFDGAEALYKRALEAEPTDTNVLNNYALLLQNVRQHYAEAEKLYLKALETAPDRADVMHNYALLMEDCIGDVEGAKEMYERALKADEDDVTTLVNYGGVLLILGDADKAENCFKQAMEIDPEEAATRIQIRRERAKVKSTAGTPLDASGAAGGAMEDAADPPQEEAGDVEMGS